MTALSSGMYLHTAGAEERPEEAYCGWTLRDRLELLAFARLVGVPPALLEALWEVIDARAPTTGRAAGTAPHRPSA